MNYIKKLQLEREQAIAARDCAAEEIQWALGYLSGAKFHEDPTVQTREVVEMMIRLRGWLQEIYPRERLGG